MSRWKEDRGPETPGPVGRKPCPYCAEVIRAEATKCRFCGEWLERRCQVCGTPVKGEWAQAGLCVEHLEKQHQVVVAAQAPVQARRLWSPGVAVVLSFLTPGLGQMYKGSIGSGVAWFFFTLVGYAALIVPGLVLHLFCLISASSGDPTKRGG